MEVEVFIIREKGITKSIQVADDAEKLFKEFCEEYGIWKDVSVVPDFIERLAVANGLVRYKGIEVEWNRKVELIRNNSFYADNSEQHAKDILRSKGFIVDGLWSEADIEGVAEQEGIVLTKDEMEDIKYNLGDIDCSLGINWETINFAIEDVKSKRIKRLQKR